jgi:hypothetical protein
VSSTTFEKHSTVLQVNYHASNEYESLGNYKVLQLGFTAINLTRVRPPANQAKAAINITAGDVFSHWPGAL